MVTLSDFKCKMFEYISEGADLQTVLNYSTDVINAPIHITDAAYKLIAASDNMKNPDPLWEELQTNGYFSEETIKKFYSTQLASNISAQTGPVFFETLGYPYVITPIYMDGNRVASLTVLVPGKEDGDNICEYMLILSDFVKNKFYIDNFHITYQNNRVELFLKDLLSGQACSQLIIDERSRYFGIEKNEYYAMLTVNTDLIGSIFPVVYFKSMVKGIYSDILSVIHNDSIVLIFKFKNFKSYEKLDLNSIEEYLRKYNMHGCISTPFRNLYSLSQIYRQTSRAIAIGRHLEPDKVIYKYSYLSLYHLLETASPSLELSVLCHPSVLRLNEYDKQHGSDYVETLYQVLIHRKKQEVQKELFIHRNTLNYRLEKIASLININWDDTEELFFLILSCRIIWYIKG